MKNKILVLCTACFCLFCIFGMIKIKNSTLPLKVNVPKKIKSFPTIGNIYAPINITVFEEPACGACIEFSNYVFPDIKKELIDTGEVSYTIVPVHFMKGSKNALLSAFCIYNHNSRKSDPEAFMEYFHRVLNHPKNSSNWGDLDTLVQLSENLTTNNNRSINHEGLKKCIESGSYTEQLKKNNIYASQVMNGQISTPAALVGDRLIEDPTMDEIRRVVKQLKEIEKINEGLDDD